MFRAVFFDLDDTLVDAMGCHIKANERVFKKFGLDYKKIEEKTKEMDFLGKRMHDILLAMRDSVNVSEDELPIEQLKQVREEIFLKLVKKRARIYQGSEKAIFNARENADVVAVISSGTRKYIGSALEKYKLKEYVDFIVGGGEVEKGKPFPDCYEKAFGMLPKNLKIKKEECLVVEDSLNGVKAAKAAGMKVVLVPSKYTKGEIDTDWTLKGLEEFDLKMFKE